MFTNIYKSKSIRLEFYIKALENKILSFKTQMHHLCFLLLECSKDSIKEYCAFNENNNNNDNVAVNEEPQQQQLEKRRKFSLSKANFHDFFMFFYLWITAQLKAPFIGTPEEKSANIKRLVQSML
jgi:hypothetical protein